MIRLIIADDHPIFSEGLAAMLSSAGDVAVVGRASTGKEALDMIEQLRPDVAVVDISMPGMSGLDVAAEIAAQGLSARVVLLTMHNNPHTAAKALKAGAAAYVLKENAFDDLLYAVRSVASGGTFLSPSLAGRALGLRGAPPGGTSPLSAREREVLLLIAQGLTNKAVAEKLFISIKTVETHRTRIMQKLDLHNTAELVRYALTRE